MQFLLSGVRYIIMLLIPLAYEEYFYRFSTNDVVLEVIVHSHHKDICRTSPEGLLSDCGDVVKVQAEVLHIKSHNKDDFLIVCDDGESRPGDDWQSLISIHGSAFGRGRACGLVVWALRFSAYFHQGCSTIITLKGSPKVFFFSQRQMKRNKTIMRVLCRILLSFCRFLWPLL